MLASLNWIKEFVDLKASSIEIADKLSMAGLEIEAVQSVGGPMENLYTATVLTVEKHPDADRLSLCNVRCGEEEVSVVCGAKNMKVGDRVVLARPGAKLANGMTIKESEIRKVRSFGMLCSETELGLAEESSGIMILSQDLPDGRPLAEVLPVADTILEVNVTPNRGDCLSMVGLAREVAANYRLDFKSKSAKVEAKKEKEEFPKVFLKAEDLCPRYSCRVIKGVKVAPSPPAIRQRLESCGVRAINNVVDATNYVMLETGQPLHAFDLSQIRKNEVRIRRAKEGEGMNTLDGEPRDLKNSDLVIADGERVLALAGVMGGEDSGVENETVDLLLESACFSPNSVRKTARRFSLQTESSYRFERGVDPNGCVKAIDRLAELIIELAGGEASGPVIDRYPNPVSDYEIHFRPSQIKRVLGVELAPKDFLDPLKGLGVSSEKVEEDSYKLSVPTFRSDLTREVDILEEIARLYGYNKIPVTFPRVSLSELIPPGHNNLDRQDRLRQILQGWGFSEVVHYSFTSPELLEKFGEEFDSRQLLLNPLSEEMSVMRPSLLPQMVETLRGNIFKGNKDLKLFEIRPVYRVDSNRTPPFVEKWHLSLGMSGARRPLHFLEKDEKGPLPEFQGITLLDLKGYLQGMVEECRPDGFLVEKPQKKPFFHPKRQVSLEWWPKNPSEKKETLGYIGRLHPRLLEEMDLPVPMIVGEINLDLFLTEWKNSIQFQEIPPFPTVWRDLNLIVAEETPNGEVFGVIRSQGGPWVRRIELFDLYRGKPLQEGQKALTYRIEYGSDDRTLTDEEVNRAREGLLKALKEKIGATLR